MYRARERQPATFVAGCRIFSNKNIIVGGEERVVLYVVSVCVVYIMVRMQQHATCATHPSLYIRPESSSTMVLPPRNYHRSYSAPSNTNTKTNTNTKSSSSGTPERRKAKNRSSAHPSPPAEVLNMLLTSKENRAQCVLTIPNHNLHCYPVTSYDDYDDYDYDDESKTTKPTTLTTVLRFLPARIFTQSPSPSPSPYPHSRNSHSHSHSHLKHNISTKSGMLRLALYWCLLVVTWMTFQCSASMSEQHTPPDWSVSPHTINDSTRCIFLISMGRQASQSKIVERFLMSTRRRGAWNGPVVLLTDAPMDRYSHLSQLDSHFIVMHPRPEHFNWETKHDMPYKRFKTFVLDYIDMDSRLDTVELVYYLDVDIVVGNSLSTFFHEIEHDYQIQSYNKHELDDHLQNNDNADPPKTSNIYFFKGNFRKTPVQGGQIILERDSAKPCLLWWRSLMDTYTNETKDQPFLKTMLEQQHNMTNTISNHNNNNHNNHNHWNHCHLQVMEQEPHLHFPSKESVAQSNAQFFWFQQQSRRSKAFPALIHIKNTGKVRDIDNRQETRYISEVLQLPYWDPMSDVGRKMHFDPDDPPWAPDTKNTNTANNGNSAKAAIRGTSTTTDWTPTYADTNETIEWLLP